MLLFLRISERHQARCTTGALVGGPVLMINESSTCPLGLSSRPLAQLSTETLEAVFTLLMGTLGGKSCCTGGENVIQLPPVQFTGENGSSSLLRPMAESKLLFLWQKLLPGIHFSFCSSVVGLFLLVLISIRLFVVVSVS